MSNSTAPIKTFRRVAVSLAVVLGVTAAASGCTDGEPGGDDDTGSETMVDANGDGDQSEDAGASDDTDADPEPSCDDIDCDDGQQCYHARCYDNCDSILDCDGDQICNGNRCVDRDCGNVDCREGYSCYRGRCYEECDYTLDCGEYGSGMECFNDGCVPLQQLCAGVECYRVQCPEREPTTVTGTVTTPSGEYPLPEVMVYVPTQPVVSLPEGAGCETCEELLSGDPLMLDLTDVEGRFELPSFPVADEVPLVIQTGKWRRQVEVTDVEPCTENELDVEQTRLPRNQEEGNIPQMAVSTGGCDPMECLVRNIGLDDSEFTSDTGSGAVHLFDGGGADEFDSGDQLNHVQQWWGDGSTMLEYDFFIDACNCSTSADPDKSPLVMLDFDYFLRSGGRAFLSHLQYTWLQEGTDDLQSIADFGFNQADTNVLDPYTGSAEGQHMRDWLSHIGALDSNDQMKVDTPNNSVQSFDESVAQPWLLYSTADQLPAYFSFNMPLGTEGDDACGRAVFTDLHYTGTGGQSFPGNCPTDELDSEQEALVYSLFDLTSCIPPECEPLSCTEVKGNCGTHADQCGGIVECGECCQDVDTFCTETGDCCDSLVCDQDARHCVEP